VLSIKYTPAWAHRDHASPSLESARALVKALIVLTEAGRSDYGPDHFITVAVRIASAPRPTRTRAGMRRPVK